MLTTAFAASARTFSVRRLCPALRAAEHACGRERVMLLMRAGRAARDRATGPAPRPARRRPSFSSPPRVIDRDFTANLPNSKLTACFTYFWTDESWVFLAVVLHLVSRRVVGWAMRAQMTAVRASFGLHMAVQRRVSPGPCCCTRIEAHSPDSTGRRNN
jgi:putative transposase